MQNRIFKVSFNAHSGGIRKIILRDDPSGMNWIKKGYSLNTFIDFRKDRCGHDNFVKKEFRPKKDSAHAIFRNSDLEIHTFYSFNDRGNLVVKNIISNPNDVEVFLLKGQIGLRICFFDSYCDAQTCMTKRCHTHIWCGGDTTYIGLLKMGESEHNLGIRFLQGGACGYEQCDVDTNERGYFVLYPDLYLLKAHEEYFLEYEIFPHTGKADLTEKLKCSPECAFVEAENTTLDEGEQFRATVFAHVTGVYLDGKICDSANIESIGNHSQISLQISSPGEHKIVFAYGQNRTTFIVCNVIERFETLLENRVRFIVEKQQYHCEGSKLDGAFLIYDNEEQKQYFDNASPDLNASRERLNMGLLLARYLRDHTNDAWLSAFRQYIAFIERELFDESTGEVFNTVGRFSEFKRLYNGPTMARLFMETFYVLHDKKYLHNMLTIMNFYYGNGGDHFYPNGICMYEMLQALKNGNMPEEYEQLKNKFLIHINNVIQRGVNYPKHEVNYEQTIVSPAISFILDGYRITGEEKYLKELPLHLHILERFDGFQPHYKLNGMAIRFWDDYWFGKTGTFGDTMPHQCSALSLSLYYKYGCMSGDRSYIRKAISGMRNMLCLFRADGAASSASVYPFRVNGNKGEFLDQFANDQDSILYLAIDVLAKDSAPTIPEN